MLCKKKDVGLNFSTWPIQDPTSGPAENFPEQKLGFVEVTETSVGISASGGGSRSHSLTAGYYRAFRELGVDDKITYISSVSGGSWASAIYTYAQMDDEKLLGKSIQPEDCTRKFLKKNNPGELPLIITKFWGIKSILYEILTCSSGSSIWQRMIGRTLLKHFGLRKKIFGFSEEHKQQVLEMNKDNHKFQVEEASVVLPKKGRPYLILNATMGGPEGYASGWGSSVQFTPLYSGVPYYAANQYSFHIKMTLCTRINLLCCGCCRSPDHFEDLKERQFNGDSGKALKLITGGGVVNTFAFGANRLEKQEDYYGADIAKGYFHRGSIFYLEDAVGASSAAYAASLENRTILSLNPKHEYFPILQEGSDKFDFNNFKGARQRNLGDGASLENTGMLALVQRGLSKIVCLINSSTKIYGVADNEEFIPNTFKYNDEICADTQLTCFFGVYHPISLDYNYSDNQIFQTEDLNEVMQELIAQCKAGNGAVIKKTLKIMKNDYWQIPGGNHIEFLFVYNHMSSKFEERLPKETLRKIKSRSSNLHNFPLYRTAFENIRPFALTRSQANLATAHAEFLLKQANKDLVYDIFSIPPDERL